MDVLADEHSSAVWVAVVMGRGSCLKCAEKRKGGGFTLTPGATTRVGWTLLLGVATGVVGTLLHDC